MTFEQGSRKGCFSIIQAGDVVGGLK